MEKSADGRASGVRTPSAETVASARSAVILENRANSVQKAARHGGYTAKAERDAPTGIAQILA